jgi:hypothetical protein
MTAYRFTGKERDPESGLDYFGARYYGSGMGRRMSPDEFTGGPVDAFSPADPTFPGPPPIDGVFDSVQCGLSSGVGAVPKIKVSKILGECRMRCRRGKSLCCEATYDTTNVLYGIIE